MLDRAGVEKLLRQSGYGDYRWLVGAQLPVRQWVRFKCRYGCPNFGKLAACPPSVPSLDECREFFAEYKHVAILRLSTSVNGLEEDEIWNRHVNQALLELERSVFLAGHVKAQVLFPGPCRLCQTCSGERRTCYRPADIRPSPEALGVDVFATARMAGFEVEILQTAKQPMARYAFLMVA